MRKQELAKELIKIAKTLTADRFESKVERLAGGKLRIVKSKVEKKATDSLRDMKLRARSRGDMSSSIISGGYYAKKQGKRMWVYPNVSYGTGVWQVTYKESDALNLINNAIGLSPEKKGKIFSVDPDLTVTVYDVEA